MSRGSILPAGMVLSGEIRGQGDLVIAGTVEGPIQIDGHLVIEPGASVRGDVKARSIVLRGTLLGPAIADETIKLESGARMVGDARAERVAVIEGALLRGRITMTGAQPVRRSSAGAVSSPGAAAAPVALAPGVSGGLGAVADARRPAPRTDVAQRPAAAPSPLRAPAPPRDLAREAASPIQRSAGGVLVAPRPSRAEEAFEEDNRTNRFVRPTDLAVPRSSAPPPEPTAAQPSPMAAAPLAAPAIPTTAAQAAPGPRTRDRRPPEPVIPGVGRQRARRKDGGAAS